MDSSVKEKGVLERENLPKPYRYTVEEYEKASFAGAFSGRVELINGEVVQMPAMKGPHIRALGNLHHEFILKLGSRAFIAQQSPVRAIEQDGEPEPDFALFDPQIGQSDSEEAPDASEVKLAVEISDTTLQYDRNVKLPIYARAGIPEVWILNLKARQLEVYREPEGEEYRSKQTYDEGQEVAPLAFSDTPIKWW